MKTKIISFFVIFSVLLIFCSEKERPVQQGENLNMNSLRAEFPFRGRIVFQSDMDGDKEIYLLTKKGLQKLTDNGWEDEYPKWSPDGKKIAFSSNQRGNYDIFIMDADGSNVSRVTTSDKDEVEHAWFPDGKKLAYTIEEKKGFRRRFTLWMIDLESKRTRKLLPEFSGYSALPDFSPSSPLMGFTGKKMVGWDVYVYDMSRKEITALTEGGKACRPHFSSDGEKIAYVSAEADGMGDIWLMNPDGSAKMRLTERDETSDYFPSWSPDEKHIVFSSSLEHRIDRGNWSLFLVEVKSKKIIPLFDSPGRDIFPDWK